MFTKQNARWLVRRLVSCDAACILQCYAAQQRDAAWLDAQTLRTVMAHGEYWGAFCAGRLVLCGGVCAADAPISLLTALQKTRLVPPKAAVILPLGGECVSAERTAYFLEVLLTRAALCFAKRPLVALAPVKTGSALLASYFPDGFILTAMRPLYALRPHYIFMYKAVQLHEKTCIIVNATDSYALSKQLEHGWEGVCVKESGVVLQSAAGGII